MFIAKFLLKDISGPFSAVYKRNGLIKPNGIVVVQY